MLHNEYIEYLKRENSSNFIESEKYYIKRKLRRFIQIDKKMLDKDKRNEEEKNFKIVHSEEDFNLQCQEDNQKESVHFLKYLNGKQNLIWQKSRGPISDISDFIINKEESCLSIEEDKILDHSESVLIISAEPGMGKSLILDKLVFDSNSQVFCLKIVLNNFTNILYDLKEKTLNLEDHQENILDFTLTYFLEKQNDLEISLLKHLVQEKELILMFDGIDEVVDYKDEVKHLIKLLRESCKFKMILITTRNHLRSELEDFFNTISFSLNHIDAVEQTNFLYNYWYSNEQNKKINNKINDLIFLEKLKLSAKDLVENVRSSLNEKISEIIGIPLQTKMIAEIYFDQFDSKENFSAIELSNLSDLYENLVEKKFNIQFEEKNQMEKDKNPKYYKKEEISFNTDHIYLSSLLFFEVKDNIEIDQEEILKYGIIVQFKNKMPKFLHQSYAEYFLAKSSFKKLKCEKDDEEIQQILKKKEFFLVRNFLEGLFQRHQTFIKPNENREKNSNSHDQEIENCCRENLYNILKYFLENKEADIQSKNQFLLIASQEGHKEIAEFLIEKKIDIKQTTEDGWNALHLASFGGHKAIVKLLIEIGIDIKQTTEDGRNALHFASEGGDNEIVKLLIEKGIDIHQTNEDGENALHLAYEGGHKETVKLLIEKGIDIHQTNEDGENALHLASREGHTEIVPLLMEKGIDINQTTEDGRNALHSASLNGHIALVEFLIEKEIDIHQTNDDGENALHSASEGGHKAIVELLIEKGININQTTEDGENALHFASREGHTEIVQILIEKGIDINQTTEDGQNALYLASEKGHKDIVQFLIEKGIDSN